jgi:uncharacterized protein
VRYLLDGYNLIHACAPLARIASDDIESARDALAEMAASLLKPGVTVQLVFDGRGVVIDRAPAVPGLDRLEAIYTPEGITADTWIERAVYNAKQRNDCAVVTGDNGIRDLCRGLGARVYSPSWFEEETAEARQDSRQRIARIPLSDAQELRNRLDTASQERLNALRRKLEDGG